MTDIIIWGRGLKKLQKRPENSIIKKLSAEKIGRPSEGAAEGGCGGNSAAPEPKRSPAALLGQSRSQQKSFLFLLEEKIRSAQIRKCRENFFAGWRALANSGGAASLVPFKMGSRKVYNYSTIQNFYKVL